MNMKNMQSVDKSRTVYVYVYTIDLHHSHSPVCYDHQWPISFSPSSSVTYILTQHRKTRIRESIPLFGDRTFITNSQTNVYIFFIILYSSFLSPFFIFLSTSGNINVHNVDNINLCTLGQGRPSSTTVHRKKTCSEYTRYTMFTEESFWKRQSLFPSSWLLLFFYSLYLSCSRITPA